MMIGLKHVAGLPGGASASGARVVLPAPGGATITRLGNSPPYVRQHGLISGASRGRVKFWLGFNPRRPFLKHAGFFNCVKHSGVIQRSERSSSLDGRFGSWPTN